MTSSTELLELAVTTAEEAGRLLLGYTDRTSLEVSTKTSSTDPVSEADEHAERLIVRRLLSARPDDGILGEEEADDRPGSSGLQWVIDPLDGTVNFLYGIPQWCVSIAVQDDTGAVAGAVHDANRDETFAAARGQGATMHGRPLRVREVDDLRQTLVTTGFAYDPEVRAGQGALVADLLADVRDIRRAGAAALDLAWVAAGRLDVYLESSLRPWDWAAGRLLVEEAGGIAQPLTLDLGLGYPVDGLCAGGRDAVTNVIAWLDKNRHG